MPPSRRRPLCSLLVAVPILFPALVSGDCPGCPPGALRVAVHLRAGGVAGGLIHVHGDWVRGFVDMDPLPLERTPVTWRKEGRFELWPRALTFPTPLEGTAFRLRGPEQSRGLHRLASPRLFDLPVIVYGRVRDIEVDTVARIEDLSIPEGHWRFEGLPYFVETATARQLLDPPRSAVFLEDLRETEDGWMIGLSFERPIPDVELVELCLTEVPPGGTWARDGVVCFHHVGST